MCGGSYGRERSVLKQNPEGAVPPPSPRGWSFKKATLTLPIKPTEHVKLVRQFFFCLVLIIFIYVLVLYLLVFGLDERLVTSQMEQDAMRVASGLKVEWDWVLSYGQVFVKKDLDKPAGNELLNSKVASENAKEMAPRSHIQMTKEISEIARTSGKFEVHLVSALPNSEWSPNDSWEKDTLQKLTSNSHLGYGQVERSGDFAQYRYLSPIVADISCLRCHRQDGFKPGQVVGAFSLSMPVTHEYSAIRRSKVATASLYGGSLGVLLFVISLLVMNLSGQLRSAYFHIEQLAREDALTRLPNRRAFYEFARMQVALSRRHGWPLTVIMADIDNFKKINDTYGHAKGDEALQNLARLIVSNIRASDIPCRWGGEEFVIALMNAPQESGGKVAERLGQLFREMRIPGIEKGVTCSFGITQLKHDETIDDAIARADSALFEAKRAGGDCWRIAENSNLETESADSTHAK